MAHVPGQKIPLEQWQEERIAENEARSAAKFKWVMGSTDLYECPECAALVAGGGWRGHAEWHDNVNLRVQSARECR